MSTFMDMFCDMLPINSEIQKPNNPFRKVLDASMGEYMDNLEDISEQLFLTTATGGWLDAFGKDYGVSRKIDEDDDSFRERIIFEKLEYLTVHNLQEIYNLQLYSYVNQFNASENTLTSDNPYLNNRYMSIVDIDLQKILNSKFILDDGILFLNDDAIDFLIDYEGNDFILANIDIYNATSLKSYFEGYSALTKVRLNLFNAVDVSYMLKNTNLEEVFLNIPNANKFGYIFDGNNGLRIIEVIIDDEFVDRFISYVESLNLPDLSSFVVNGVEQL